MLHDFYQMPPKALSIQKIPIATITVTVRESEKVHPGFRRFQNKQCNVNDTWRVVFDKAGIKLNPESYNIISAGGKACSRDLNEKINEFKKKFKKKPPKNEYKISVRKIRPELQHSSQNVTPRISNRVILEDGPHQDTASNAPTVKMPSKNNSRLPNLPPPVHLLQDGDYESQFADSANDVEMAGSSNGRVNSDVLNHLVSKRLKEFSAYKDAMLLVQEEVRKAYDTDRWRKFKLRFPLSSHLLADLFKPQSK